MNHLAIIPDGNRRFGRRLGKETKGHEIGAEALIRIITWFILTDSVKQSLTVYCFSEENWKRSLYEIESIMELARQAITDVENLLSAKTAYKLTIFERALKDDPDTLKMLQRDSTLGKRIGLKICSTSALNTPPDINAIIERVNKHYHSKTNWEKTINLCFNYSGRADIIQAAAAAAATGEVLTAATINAKLIVKEEPDLIIRTSGEQRMSNFLTWQSSYSELLFLECLWPEITVGDIERAVADFEFRGRRFGS